MIKIQLLWQVMMSHHWWPSHPGLMEGKGSFERVNSHPCSNFLIAHWHVITRVDSMFISKREIHHFSAKHFYNCWKSCFILFKVKIRSYWGLASFSTFHISMLKRCRILKIGIFWSVSVLTLFDATNWFSVIFLFWPRHLNRARESKRFASLVNQTVWPRLNGGFWWALVTISFLWSIATVTLTIFLKLLGAGGFRLSV